MVYACCHETPLLSRRSMKSRSPEIVRKSSRKQHVNYALYTHRIRHMCIFLCCVTVEAEYAHRCKHATPMRHQSHGAMETVPRQSVHDGGLRP